MKNFFVSLVSATQGSGPSSTRFVYLVNGVAAAIGALVMTLGGIQADCFHERADPVYWGGTAALWTASLGFGSKTKDHQQTASKERALARSGQMVPAMSGD